MNSSQFKRASKTIASNQGFCDGLLGRKMQNPYGYENAISMEYYNAGYYVGLEKRKEYNITITIEREVA